MRREVAIETATSPISEVITARDIDESDTRIVRNYVAILYSYAGHRLYRATQC